MNAGGVPNTCKSSEMLAHEPSGDYANGQRRTGETLMQRRRVSEEVFRYVKLYQQAATSVDGEWKIVEGLEIDDFSRAEIDASVKELLHEKDTVKGLGLI